MLPADGKLIWMVCADAMVVAVVKVADRGAAVVCCARLRPTFVAFRALQ